MSFKCGSCGELQWARTSPTKVAVKVREVTYRPTKKGTREGHGIEIVKEDQWCPGCVKEKLELHEPQIIGTMKYTGPTVEEFRAMMEEQNRKSRREHADNRV